MLEFVSVSWLALCALLLRLLYEVPGSNGARILAVLPTPSISHMDIYRPVLRELSLRGHQVVAILPDPLRDATLTNLTEIDVHEAAYPIWRAENRLAKTRIEQESSMQSFAHMSRILRVICDAELAHADVQRLINDPDEHFDLVINEWLMYASTFAFGDRFHCPIVGISSMPLFITGYDSVGSPTHPAYALDFWQISGEHLSFWEVLDNTWYSLWFRVYYRLVVLARHDEVARKHFGNHIRYVGDIERDVSLILVNTNPIFHVARPFSPAIIEIGGIHMKERKPLPEDLKTFLDAAVEGVVYFSLGSNVISNSLPEETLAVIVQAFSSLPYQVLWKWESEELHGKGDNIKIGKWFPQQDVLDHPNIKVFITQAGLQSVEESIRSQVPMIGIPFAGDQDYNVARIVTHGIGKQLLLHDLTVSNLYKTVVEVATNPTYKERIIEMSNTFWDQPMKPLDRAIWWIEYVLRHKGAKALRSPTVDLPWYRFLLLDVIGFVLAILVIGLLALRIVLQTMSLFFKWLRSVLFVSLAVCVLSIGILAYNEEL